MSTTPTSASTNASTSTDMKPIYFLLSQPWTHPGYVPPTGHTPLTHTPHTNNNNNTAPLPSSSSSSVSSSSLRNDSMRLENSSFDDADHPDLNINIKKEFAFLYTSSQSSSSSSSLISDSCKHHVVIRYENYQLRIEVASSAAEFASLTGRDILSAFKKRITEIDRDELISRINLHNADHLVNIADPPPQYRVPHVSDLMILHESRLIAYNTGISEHTSTPQFHRVPRSATMHSLSARNNDVFHCFSIYHTHQPTRDVVMYHTILTKHISLCNTSSDVITLIVSLPLHHHPQSIKPCDSDSLTSLVNTYETWHLPEKRFRRTTRNKHTGDDSDSESEVHSDERLTAKYEAEEVAEAEARLNNYNADVVNINYVYSNEVIAARRRFYQDECEADDGSVTDADGTWYDSDAQLEAAMAQYATVSNIHLRVPRYITLQEVNNILSRVVSPSLPPHVQALEVLGVPIKQLNAPISLQAKMPLSANVARATLRCHKFQIKVKFRNEVRLIQMVRGITSFGAFDYSQLCRICRVEFSQVDRRFDFYHVGRDMSIHSDGMGVNWIKPGDELRMSLLNETSDVSHNKISPALTLYRCLDDKIRGARAIIQTRHQLLSKCTCLPPPMSTSSSSSSLTSPSDPNRKRKVDVDSTAAAAAAAAASSSSSLTPNACLKSLDVSWHCECFTGWGRLTTTEAEKYPVCANCLIVPSFESAAASASLSSSTVQEHDGLKYELCPRCGFVVKESHLYDVSEGRFDDQDEYEKAGGITNILYKRARISSTRCEELMVSMSNTSTASTIRDSFEAYATGFDNAMQKENYQFFSRDQTLETIATARRLMELYFTNRKSAVGSNVSSRMEWITAWFAIASREVGRNFSFRDLKGVVVRKDSSNFAIDMNLLSALTVPGFNSKVSMTMTEYDFEKRVSSSSSVSTSAAAAATTTMPSATHCKTEDIKPAVVKDPFAELLTTLQTFMLKRLHDVSMFGTFTTYIRPGVMCIFTTPTELITMYQNHCKLTSAGPEPFIGGLIYVLSSRKVSQKVLASGDCHVKTIADNANKIATLLIPAHLQSWKNGSKAKKDSPTKHEKL